MSKQRERGQYMTKPVENIYELQVFRDWIAMVPSGKFMEPFAGGCDIPRLMSQAGFEREWSLFDIEPQKLEIQQRDMLSDFPTDHDCVAASTNCPFLASNSAARRGISFPENDYDDLYKFSLKIMLDNFDYVACIVPESFITQNLFHYRIYAIISLTTTMFSDTDCPSCLALFMPNHHSTFSIYRMGKFIGKYSELKECLVQPKKLTNIAFNVPDGEFGLHGIDDTKRNTIEFVRGETIPSSIIKPTSRSITRFTVKLPIGIEVDDVIAESNKILENERIATEDVFYTAFKGLRSDGKFRRRLDFKNVKRIISFAIEQLGEKNG